MPDVRTMSRPVRKLLQLSVALLLCAAALGARTAYAQAGPALCLQCSTANPCPGSPASRLICCSVASGKKPFCSKGWDINRNCGTVVAYCAPLGD
jgi:hypothetical protein